MINKRKRIKIWPTREKKNPNIPNNILAQEEKQPALFFLEKNLKNYGWGEGAQLTRKNYQLQDTTTIVGRKV